MQMIFKLTTAVLTGGALLLGGCTQEQQNKISRDIQNWTGTNGVLEIYAGDKVVRRFLKVDKLSTALGTDDGKPRNYRYGYGVLDENLNMQVDPTEKRSTLNSVITPTSCSLRIRAEHRTQVRPNPALPTARLLPATTADEPESATPSMR